MVKKTPIKLFIRFILLVGLLSLSISEIVSKTISLDWVFIFGIVITLVSVWYDKDILKIVGG